VTPRASRNRLELTDDVLRVYITAPPADGQANKAVLEIVAKALRVPKSAVAIAKGEASRNKVLLIHGLSANELAERLDSLT